MNRRHTIAASLIAAAALTITTVATTAGAQSATAPTSTSTVPTITLTASTNTDQVSTARTLVAAQQARQFQTIRSVQVAAANYAAVATASALQAIHTATVKAQLTALVEAHNAVQGSMWSCIRIAESGGNYGDVSGAYGILISSWNAYSSVWAPYGSWSVPGEAPAAVQDLVAYRLYQIGGGFGGWNDRCTGR